jgi:hypothetical protein
MSTTMNYVFNPFSPVPISWKSHVRGWALHWASNLGSVQIALKGSDLSKADSLYLDHGVNFSGAMNLFGGVTDEIVGRIRQVVDQQGDLYSLDIPMPNYAEQLRKRIGQSTCSHQLSIELIDRFEAKLATAKTLTQKGLSRQTVVIGDSHTTAFSPAKSTILRTNGQTLFGALKNDLIHSQLDSLGYSPERVCLVYGSIDIRHHIGRQDQPYAALESLCEDYAKAVRRVKADWLCDVEVAAPVPVEHEERRIPQSGFYEGKAFSGSREERLSWTVSFISAMQKHGVNVVSPPEDWYLMDGKHYADTHMELSSSVHIAPLSYRRFDWGSFE